MAEYKCIYLVNCDTELYSSETRILGVYTTLDEAIGRIKREQNVGKMENGCFGSCWRNRNAGLRYYLSRFALGDQRGHIHHRGTIVTIS